MINVSTELLAALAALAPGKDVATNTEAVPASSTVADHVELEAWLTKSGLTFKPPTCDSLGRTIYRLAECPFNPDHLDGDAAVGVMPNGARFFNCFHNGCAGREWSDLRKRFGPVGQKSTPVVEDAPPLDLETAKQRVADLLDRVRVDRGVAFAPEVVAALVVIEEGDTELWTKLRAELAEAGVNLDDLEEVMSGAVPGGSVREGGPGGGMGTALVDLAIESGAELWATPGEDATGYVSQETDTQRVNFRIRSKKCKHWLTNLARQELKKTPGAQVLNDALNALEAAALDGDRHFASYRIARGPDGIYLDLGSPTWEAVRVNADGWSIVAKPPVRFVRFAGMEAIPPPVKGGKLEEIGDFLNLSSKEDLYLAEAFAVSAVRPEGPFNAWISTGEHGSAKSTFAKMLKTLLDPNMSPLRTPPSDERNLMITATHNWILSFDNLSTMQPWLSDAICRLTHGAGFATRELWSNDDETILMAKRPVMLNGIEDFATRPDLLSRALIVHHPVIPDEKRRDEEELWRTFEAARPRLLGALLDAVATAERRLPEIRATLKKLPRMADFARWIAAAEPAFGCKAGEILALYEKNRLVASDLALEGSILVPALRKLLDAMPKNAWSGTASSLLSALGNQADDDTKRQKSWPKAAHTLSGALRRLAPSLRSVGIEFTVERETTGSRAKRITLMKVLVPGPASGGNHTDSKEGSGPKRSSGPASAYPSEMERFQKLSGAELGAVPSTTGSGPSSGSAPPSAPNGTAPSGAPTEEASHVKSRDDGDMDDGSLGTAPSGGSPVAEGELDPLVYGPDGRPWVDLD